MQKITIEEMRKIAEELGGKCLSETYIDARSKLIWQCEHGHQWEATAVVIKRGYWCPTCARPPQKSQIEGLQEIAEGRGGQCLSKEYIDSNTALTWQCKDGHRWEADPIVIKQGYWCPTCAGPPQKSRIEELQEIAEGRGGKCLSKEYISSGFKLKWQCKEGHQWEATPDNVKQGYWCRACAVIQRSSTIEEMQEIAKKHGGKCLSDKYINSVSKLKWQCKEGHQWEAIPGGIKQGGWCPVCGGWQKKGTIEEMQEIAEKRGGKCLSKKYINTKSKLKWQCKEGHQWRAVPNHIQQGSWCPACAGMQRRSTIEEMQEIAKEHGGQCLSKEYINSFSKLKLQCKDGHQWEAIPNHIQQGSWCPVCGGKKKSTIEELQAIAEKRGGKCLSKEYINSFSKLKWQCMDGHQWEAVPDGIKQGHWCHVCGGWQKGTIEEMRETAKEHSGKCLSKKYINTKSKLKWQCKDGHQWRAAPANIKKGSWCPTCAGLQRRSTIEEMQDIAKEHGGKCLSDKLINADSKLKWQCKDGHQWRAVPAGIKKGSWCPACAGIQRRSTIEEMQEIAKEHGGKCLSEKYINAESKLKWQCKEGHQWEATPSGIKQGYWCPSCGGWQKGTIKEMREMAEEHGGKCLSKKYINTKSKLKWQCKENHRWEATPNHIQQGSWCPACAGKR